MKHHLFPIALITLLSACTDEEQLLNRDIFAYAESEIVYQAPDDAALNSFPAAQPVAVSQISTTEFIYLDKQTRNAVLFDTSTNTRSILFELAKYEDALNPDLAFQGSWGTALIKIGHGWFLVAAQHRALLAFNIDTRQVQIVGSPSSRQNLQNPAAGLALRDVDFSMLAGIGLGTSGLYVAFDKQVFRIPGSPNDGLETFLNTPMIHIAGAPWKDDDSDNHSHDAHDIRLSLATFTEITEFDNRLFFWDSTILRIVYDGKIAAITGNGSMSPTTSLVDFYANGFSDFTRIIVNNGELWTPYLQGKVGILKVQIDALSMTNDQPVGVVSLAYPQVGSISAWTRFNNQLLTVDMGSGEFYLIDPNTLQITQHIARNDNERDDLLGVTMIAPILDNTRYLVYAPISQTLSLFNPQTQANKPIWGGNIDNIITDGNNRIWFSNGIQFYYMSIDQDNQLSYKYSERFFAAPAPMGIPCEHSRFRLPEAPLIRASGQNLLMYAQNNTIIAQYKSNDDNVKLLHERGWTSLTTQDNFINNTLQTKTIQFWRATDRFEAMILQANSKQYLAIANLQSSKLQFAGTTIKYDSARIISGNGTQPIGENIAADDVYLDKVTALDIDSSGRIVIMSDGVLYTIDDNGLYQKYASQIIPKHITPYNIHILGNTGTEIIYAESNDQALLCSQNNMYLGNMQSSPACVQTDITHIDACDSQGVVYTVHNQLCYARVSQSPQSPRCTPLPDELQIRDLTCQNQSAFVSAQDATGYSIYSIDLNTQPTLVYLMGKGPGLPDSGELGELKLGANTGGIQYDQNYGIYFWMKDTCSIWKIVVHPGEEISDKTVATRLVTDSMLCDADLFAVKPDGTIAIARDKMLYRLNPEGFGAFAAYPNPPVELIGMGNAFILMTTGGLYSFEDDLIRHMQSPVDINHISVDYGKRGPGHPRMAQSGYENAVLVPVFYKNRIVKLSLSERH